MLRVASDYFLLTLYSEPCMHCTHRDSQSAESKSNYKLASCLQQNEGETPTAQSCEPTSHIYTSADSRRQRFETT